MGGVFRYVNPASIYWGLGSLQRLGEELDRASRRGRAAGQRPLPDRGFARHLPRRCL